MRHGVPADASLPLWTPRASAVEGVSSICSYLCFTAHCQFLLSDDIEIQVRPAVATQAARTR